MNTNRRTEGTVYLLHLNRPYKHAKKGASP